MKRKPLWQKQAAQRIAQELGFQIESKPGWVREIGDPQWTRWNTLYHRFRKRKKRKGMIG